MLSLSLIAQVCTGCETLELHYSIDLSNRYLFADFSCQSMDSFGGGYMQDGGGFGSPTTDSQEKKVTVFHKVNTTQNNVTDLQFLE